MTRCPHTTSDRDLGGCHCALTGASVADDCGAGSEECMPKKAQLYARGERVFLADLSALEREAVIACARLHRKRLLAAKGTAGSAPAGSAGVSPAHPALDLSSLSDDQFAAIVAEHRRRRWAARRQARYLASRERTLARLEEFFHQAATALKSAKV
jgi:hypothetical protein